MKILVNREVFTPPAPAAYQYQILTYDDRSQEYDAYCAQTTAILTAELYNGKAAKDDNGNWIPAPGPRNHEDEIDLVGFHVGLTYVGHDADNKAIYDYTVITPTGVAFHGDGQSNVLHAPPHWETERVAAEMIMWICVGEDAGTDFPENTTPEQWEWIRSYEREIASADIDMWVEEYDGGLRHNLVDEDRSAAIEARAKLYAEEEIFQNQSGLVTWLLNNDEYLHWEDVTNLMVDVDAMDGYALATFIDEELSQDWKKLRLIDIEDYYFPPEDDALLIDAKEVWGNLNPLDLHDYDIEQLRDYIRENYSPGEIYEWWLVSEMLAEELEQLGESTLTDGWSHWWGRRCTGQAILMDGTIQQIAEKYI